MNASGAPAGLPVTRRLTFRVSVALCAGAAAILAVAAAWNISLQRRNMTSLLTSSAVRSADMVRHATRDAMLENRRDRLQMIMERLAQQPDIADARIFDKTGRIHYSSQPAEIGTSVDTEAEPCIVCHGAERAEEHLTPERRVRQFEADGHGIVAVTTPIPNEPACSSGPCHAHPPERKVLGVLDVQLQMDRIESFVTASEWQLALGLGLTTLALVGLAAFVTWRLVIAPVRRLTAKTRHVAEGDLGARAPVTSDDEIGELTETWNETVEELQTARSELDDLVATLEQRVEEKTRELTQAHEQMLDVEKMASLGKLAAVVAHEVNNPLAGIATYARLLRKRAARAPEDLRDDETLRILELVESEAARCGEIVRNLLLFSRTPGRRFEETPLCELLERCVLLVRHQAELQQVALTLSVEDELPAVVCDPSQVQQLILALAMNAIEAMSDGGELRVAAERGAEDTVVLTVEDTGPGIPEEDLPHVFEPFYTTKPEGKGVGLGLAVVYGIARRHGGTVGVTSAPGRGTRFAVRLPRVPPGPVDDGPRLLEGVIS